MELWKEERWRKELIKGKNERSVSLTRRVPGVSALAFFLFFEFPLFFGQLSPLGRAEGKLRRSPKPCTIKEIQ